MAYTYYIYHEPTQQHYYGARWARNADPSDFWVTYFTSSRRVKQLIKQYGENSFKVKIRRVFNTGTQARLWEHKVLKRIRASSRSDWLNISNGQPPVCNYSRVGQGLGRKLSEKHKQSISKSNKGKPKPQTEEHKNKCTASRIGTKRSAETRQLMSGSSRKAKPVYTFVNNDIIFIGNLSDWAEKYNLNVHSAATSFCKKKPYKGWVRQV